MSTSADRHGAPIGIDSVIAFVTGLLGPVLHLKQAKSIAQAVIGAMHADRWSVAAVGRALAQVLGMSPKHGIKQFDRLLSNDKVRMEDAFLATVPWLVARREEIVVSLDWTEYADDGHSRLALNLVTNHGRATPLVWKTHETKKLKWRRNRYEDKLLLVLADSLPPGVKVTLLADRGFGDSKLYHFLREDLGWDFVIRFRADITVTTPAGEKTPAGALVPSNGQIREVVDALVTNERFRINVVCVKHRGMKDAWCLATTLAGRKQQVVELYGRRFTIEENFRDEKDQRFGFGLEATSIGRPERRDRFLLVAMLATIQLTLLGAAGEEIGCDRQLKANTTARRTHSLLRQGREYLRGCAARFAVAIRHAFDRLIRRHPLVETTLALL